MKRRASGSGIIEGVLGLMLVIGGGVCATLLVLNSGTGIFFKEKLVIITNLSAQYAAAHAADSGLDSEVQAYVAALMPQCGLSPSNLNVQVTAPASFTVNGQTQNGVRVTVSNQFPLFGNGTILPYQIQLADTEFSGPGGLGGGMTIAGVLSIRSNDMVNSEPTELLVPVVYEGNNGNNVSTVMYPLSTPSLPSQLVGLPNWSLDTSGVAPVSKQGMLPN